MPELTPDDLAYAELYAWPCRFGWNVSGADTSIRLYALDAGPTARWQNPPRTIERAVSQTIPSAEGARAVLVLVGDRNVSDEVLERCRDAAAAAVLKTLRENR